MFLHMGIGKPGRWSAGNGLTVFGAVLLAVAMLITGIAVLTT
jgi:heme/copper-type cytochrome/quinol oxidase subunit 4